MLTGLCRDDERPAGIPQRGFVCRRCCADARSFALAWGPTTTAADGPVAKAEITSLKVTVDWTQDRDSSRLHPRGDEPPGPASDKSRDVAQPGSAFDWGQKVAGSNPVVPTIAQIRPFGEYVERFSLFQNESCVVQSTVQTDRFEDLASDGVV